jgi:hypothetical protein
VGNRTTFWLIWAVALVPMVAAFVMYFGKIGVPDGRTHHGELVESGTQYSDIGLPSPGDPPKWQVDVTKLTVPEPSIWVIDPLGNVVLKFEPEINPTLILQDLKKLLKVSKVG